MTEEALQRAYRYCEWITAHHYENFPVASRLLPRALRPDVAAVYAFARSADDFADEARYHGRSLELLDQWRENLRTSVVPDPAGSGTVRFHPIFLALSHTVRRHDLPVQLLDDLLTAFTMDVTKRRYADWPDLMNYCKHSANPVGRLVLLLSRIRDEELHARSDDICTALQLANHWQDLRIDLGRDILYIPQDLMRSFGVTEGDLGKMAPRTDETYDRFRLLMKELVARTRALFDSGEPLTRHLKGGLRLEIKLTLLGGRTILDRIEAADYDVFRHRPALSVTDKLCLLTRALLP
ncbi:MAG: squalene synthase HpnC [Candidatus Omnitrophota bacterium]|nr:squalene synthase HpnC [Candidatus Omnitrophota bacterium]